MYAIMETGGKQYRVQVGDSVRIEKLDLEVGAKVEFDKILAVVDDADLNVGKPLVEGAKVAATVEIQGKNKKIIAYKFKSKEDYRNKKGHRQPFTQVKIESIVK